MAAPLQLSVGNSKFVKSATGLEVEEGPISRVHEIKTPKVDRVLLRQYHQTREFVTGTLCLTDRQLIFVEPTGAQETWVLYHHISGVERLSLTTRGYPLVLSCKTFQQLYLIIPRESDLIDIMDTINMFAQPKVYSELYAFQYRPQSSAVKQRSGWKMYEPELEYGRMGLPNDNWQSTDLNKKYELCDTYSTCLYVPACASQDIIQGSAKFRSKGRLPILAYHYAPQKSALCRSSQPLAGLLGRSPEDEEMIQCILRASPNCSILHVMDTRPRINAMANRAAGKGYEAAGYYPNTDYQFYNIHNIHVMRESLQKLIEGVHAAHQTVSGFLSVLESSSWLRHIQLILEASLFSSKSLQSGASVLVHCSDGWDRTAQTCALTSLFLDPYYHSLHGFMVLIEKEWLSCGHKFSQRCGHIAIEEKETSPIFTQFLDCVWQLTQQFPTLFQFNEHFLITLHDHTHSCQFGTFLGNCERERNEQRFSELTYSLWGHIWAHLDDFINPLYQRGGGGGGGEEQRVLEPVTDIRHLKFWKGLYGRYVLHDRLVEKEEELMASLRQQNACLEEHILFITQSIKALELGLEKLKKRKQEAASRQSGEDSSSSPVECNGSDTTTDRDTEPSLQEERSSLSPPPLPFPPSPHRLSPSPTSSAEFRGYLDHLPEMNLPWQPLRSVTRCSCGRAFTFLVSKYHCSYCGSVACDVCASNHAPLPWHATQQPHRVCRPCHKLMKRRLEMETSQSSTNS